MVILEEITSPVLNVTDLANSSFGATLVAPSDNIDTYILEAQLISADTVDWVEVKKINSFPKTYDLSVSAQELATVFGIELADFSSGDQINFNAYVIGDNGDTATWDNLDQDLGTNPGQKQGFRFTTYVSCPFIAAESAGTYRITVDEMEAYYNDLNYDLIVVAGPGENQITLKNIFDHPDPDNPGQTYDVIVDVDPATGIATVDKQPAWHSSNFGMPYGVTSVEGGGFVFTCTGTIILTMEHTVALGSFGTALFVAVKQ
jgi:spore coat protein U-like protein